MKRLAVLVYGVACYLMFLGVFLYAIGFVGGALVPTTLDGPLAGPLGGALAVNALLMAVFAVQHSGMARPAFKRWWTRFVPQPIERSTYCLCSNLALILLFWQWRPMGGAVWDVQAPAARTALHALGAAGWLLVLVT